MKKVLVFGHKNPDTDSVTSAISLSYLKNIKNGNCIPCILGEINNETKFVLNYFKVDKPIYLNDVKLQVSDLKYLKGCFLNENNTLDELYDYMQKEEITGVPICNSKGNYKGLVTMKDLLKVIINPHYDSLKTNYDNILDILKGIELLRFKNEIDGKIILFSCKPDRLEESINLSKDNILIVGNRPNIIRHAIMGKVQLIIVVGAKKLDEELFNLARKNRVNIITTMKEISFVSKMIILSNYINSIMSDSHNVLIDDGMYLNDFLTIANKYKYTNYPILDRKGKVLGLLRSEDVHDKTRKKVILVDHNEYTQSVDGIEEADILEIIDHHKVGNINSSNPINFRNMAVGSTNTIIYEMMKEEKVKPTREIAGLMLSGIISDTLLFHSPTTTIYDKKAVDDLVKIAKIDLDSYAKKMFMEAASIKGKTIEELIYNAFKAFNINNRKIGIGQMTVVDYQKILKDIDKYVNVLEKISKEHDYDVLAFCVTDVINSNTYLLYNEKAKTIFETIFNAKEMYEGYKLEGVVSRKKQIIPLLMEELK